MASSFAIAEKLMATIAMTTNRTNLVDFAIVGSIYNCVSFTSH